MTLEFFAALISAICFVESSHVPSAVNLTDGGSASYGYCGMKYATAKMLGYKGHISDLWFDRRVNKNLAAAYLKKQYKRYKDVNKAIAAYNAGSLKNGEIRNVKYVRQVLNALKEGR